MDQISTPLEANTGSYGIDELHVRSSAICVFGVRADRIVPFLFKQRGGTRFAGTEKGEVVRRCNLDIRCTGQPVREVIAIRSYVNSSEPVCFTQVDESIPGQSALKRLWISGTAKAGIDNHRS